MAGAFWPYFKQEHAVTLGLSPLEISLTRAELKRSLGRFAEARGDYLEILKRYPNNTAALRKLGAVFQEMGDIAPAIAVYEQVLELEPDAPVQVALGNLLWAQHDHDGARRRYELALELDPNSKEAHAGLVNFFSEQRDSAAALEHGKKAYAGRSVYTLPGWAPPRAPKILMVYTATGGNIPLETVMDRSAFHRTALIAEYHAVSAPLPAHDLVWNAIGDADFCAEALSKASEFLKATRAPVLNPPGRVASTGRSSNAARLSAIEGLVVPKIKDFSRLDLEAPEAPALLQAQGFTFPLLLRAQGFHAGKHFVKLEGPDELTPALAAMPGVGFSVLQYVDTAKADGSTRKYRTMMIDGRLYPLHAAVAKHWKIHFASADMSDKAANRAEDEAFLTNMPAALGPRAVEVLGRVQRALGLDYAGMDFSVDGSGAVVLYECNATMVIPEPDAGAKWDYRRGPVKAIVDAVNAMLHARLKAAL